MFALIGLIFMMIKIAILATAYASVTLLFLYIFARTTEIKWIKKLMHRKIITWLISGFIYSISLFVYAFSYWGYSGLGDYFCIPAGHGFVVSSIDAQDYSYFEPERKKYSRQVFMKKFKIKDEKVCGEFLGFNSDDCLDCFIVFDTKDEKLYEFYSSADYFTFAKKNNLPQPSDFVDFNQNYREYWHGMRNFFLP
jgi:hypothetical protein